MVTVGGWGRTQCIYKKLSFDMVSKTSIPGPMMRPCQEGRVPVGKGISDGKAGLAYSRMRQPWKGFALLLCSARPWMLSQRLCSTFQHPGTSWFEHRIGKGPGVRRSCDNPPPPFARPTNLKTRQSTPTASLLVGGASEEM